VVVNVPTCNVTSSLGGLIPLLSVLLKVKLQRKAKSSLFGPLPKWIAASALKARKGTPGGGGTMAMAEPPICWWLS
jgi:hypothetical protein